MIKISAYTTSAGENDGINEDCFVMKTARMKFCGIDECETRFSTEDLPLIVSVMDGVGGHPNGKSTSEMTGRKLLTFPLDMELKEMVEETNCSICENPDHGYTTISAIKITGKTRGNIVSIGDSRVYRLRDREIKCLTRDDSSREFFALFYGEEEGKRRGFLTACLGKKKLEIEDRDIFIKDKDIYVLLTDGAYDSVLTKNWSKFIDSEAEPGERIVDFLKTIVEHGGFVKDNATAVIMEIREDPEHDPANDMNEWEF